MAQYVKRLHQNLSTDGNGSTFTMVAKDERDLGHLIVHASGTFGGGTVQLHFLSNNNVWRDTGAVAMTSAGWVEVVLIPDTDYRIVLTGSTSPTLFYEVGANGAFDIFLDF